MSQNKQTVCVTGASGFVGSRITADLLERGYRVHATVRDPSNTEKYGFLLELPGADKNLELFRGQLLEDGCFDDALADSDYCIHTASPYVLDVDDAQKDLVDPAVQGTENVLQCALKAGVNRVVVTSSMAAVTDEPGEKVLTEEDWNEKSSLKRNPYYLSKVEAEKAAWRFDEEHDEIDVVVINPFLVIGPSLTPSLNQSNKIFIQLFDGEFPGIVSLTWGMVDVRDVSEAHILAMENDEAQGRFICVDNVANMAAVVDILRETGWAERYKLPKMNLAHGVGDAMVKLFSYLQPSGTGSYLRTNVGRVPRFDSSKSKEVLGLEYRPVEETIVDTVEDMDRWGHLP